MLEHKVGALKLLPALSVSTPACYVPVQAIGMFRLMGALGRDYNRTNVYGSFAMVLTILLGGFVLRKSSIHPWYIW